MRNGFVSAFVAVLALGSVVVCSQAPPSADAASFRVGLKSIAIPAPSTELVETGSDYRVLLDVVTPVSNRLVAAFLLPEDLKAITTGPAFPSRYALVQVPRPAEFATIAPGMFKEIAGSVGREFGASLEATAKEQQDELNRRLRALGSNSSTVTFDTPVMLGSFFFKPDALGFGSIVPVEANGRKTRMVMSVAVVRAQERVLLLYLFSTYIDQASVDWVRTTGEKWADAVLAANK
jgi:hypothetical protein